MEVEMRIRGLVMDPVTNMPIVILKDVNGASVLPIWVGIYEANAIALEIEKVTTPRPMTHDLLKNLLLGLETHVQKVVVSELREDTFYALIWLERDGQMMSIDSRPSDALALALRVDCPIYVEDEVLKNSKSCRGRQRKGEQRRTAEVAGRFGRRRHGTVQDVGTGRAGGNSPWTCRHWASLPNTRTHLPNPWPWPPDPASRARRNCDREPERRRREDHDGGQSGRCLRPEGAANPPDRS